MTTDAENLYELQDVIFNYDSTFTLSIPSLNIEKGSALGFVGPNGCGKSTLLRILAFLKKPSHGEVFFKGMQFGSGDVHRFAVTFLMQDPYLLKRTVFDNIAYGYRKKKGHAPLNQAVNDAMIMVDLKPEIFAARRWYQLSGGEAQRVALAARLILNPEVLILDEPVSNIDVTSTDVITHAVMSMHQRYGTTLLATSHDLFWLSSIAEDLIRLHDGMIVGSGTENILKGPWSQGRDGLFEKKLDNGQVVIAPPPPDKNAAAILDPRDVLLATEKQEHVSARNHLSGRIESLSLDKRSGLMTVSLQCGTLKIYSHVTVDSVRELGLLPGNDVWAIFKASSLRWD
jgi:tungstate transport system ATP-binding protein